MSDEFEASTLVKRVRSNDPVATGSGVACLILLYPAGPNLGRRQTLDDAQYIIGRTADADFVVDRESISRRHARLTNVDDEWVVDDLGSTNGTFVNEKLIKTRKLRDGDQIRIGDAIFKFLSGSNLESAYHEEIYRMTILDGLTGIHNKRYFLEFLDRELARSQRHGHPLSLVMFDIDHFKQINDERGHLAGDAVLRQLADRVKARIRREDLLARFGGEEFAVILSVTSKAGGVLFAEDVRLRVAETPFAISGGTVDVTVSLGVTGIGPGDPKLSAEELIAVADAKLYDAKRNGRNCVES